MHNAAAVARFLRDHPAVRQVFYSGLPESPCWEHAQKYLPDGVGAVLAFEVHGEDAAAQAASGQAVVDALQLHSLVANVGDVRSLAIHPASTTHRQLSPADQKAGGVKPGMVRLSVGIEHLDDIVADLQQALDAVAQSAPHPAPAAAAPAESEAGAPAR